MTLLAIYLKIKGHLTSMATAAKCQPLCLAGLSFVFQQANVPKHTSRLCKGSLTRKESDIALHQVSWPSHHLT